MREMKLEVTAPEGERGAVRIAIREDDVLAEIYKPSNRLGWSFQVKRDGDDIFSHVSHHWDSPGEAAGHILDHILQIEQQ